MKSRFSIDREDKLRFHLGWTESFEDFLTNLQGLHNFIPDQSHFFHFILPNMCHSSSIVDPEYLSVFSHFFSFDLSFLSFNCSCWTDTAVFVKLKFLDGIWKQEMLCVLIERFLSFEFKLWRYLTECEL